MNKNRRKQIEKIIEQLSLIDSAIGELKLEEESYYEEIPESLQGSKRAHISEAAISDMEEAQCSVVDAMDSLQAAVDQ